MRTKERTIHPSLKIFSTNISTLRSRKNLSYKELGKLANLSGEMIKHLEKGNRGPSLNSALLLCEALDTKLTVLLREENQVGEQVYGDTFKMRIPCK